MAGGAKPPSNALLERAEGAERAGLAGVRTAPCTRRPRRPRAGRSRRKAASVCSVGAAMRSRRAARRRRAPRCAADQAAAAVHCRQAAEEQIHTTGAMRASACRRPQPGEHPVDHAEQQHRQRLVEPRGAAARAAPRRPRRRRRRRPAFACQHARRVAWPRNFTSSVSTRWACCALGVCLDEAQDQLAQPRLGRERLACTSATSASKPRDMAFGDLRQQLVLVAHVVVERGLGDAAGAPPRSSTYPE